MTITIETTRMEEVEQLLLFIKTMELHNIKIKSSKKKSTPNITRGDKTIDPMTLFGIWKDNPRTIEQIRESAWNRTNTSDYGSL